MSTLVVVPKQKQLQVIFQLLNGRVNLAAHRRYVKLVHQRLMQPFTRTVGPGVAGLDKGQFDAKFRGQAFVGVVRSTGSRITPLGRGELGAIVQQATVDAEILCLGNQLMLQEVAGMLCLARGAQRGDSVTGNDIDGQVMVNRADALEPADEEGVLTPELAGVGHFEVAGLGLLSGSLQFVLGNDLAELDAGPFLTLFATIDTVTNQYAVHAIVADSDAAMQFVGDSLGAVAGIVFDVIENDDLVVQAGAIGRATAWREADEGRLSADSIGPEILCQCLSTGRGGQSAVGPLTEATGEKGFNLLQTIAFCHDTISHMDLLGYGAFLVTPLWPWRSLFCRGSRPRVRLARLRSLRSLRRARRTSLAYTLTR